MAHMYARAWHHAEHKFACTVLWNYTVEDTCILAMHSTYDDGTRKKTNSNPNIRIIISIYLSILLLTLWGWCLYYEELILLFILEYSMQLCCNSLFTIFFWLFSTRYQPVCIDPLDPGAAEAWEQQARYAKQMVSEQSLINQIIIII